MTSSKSPPPCLEHIGSTDLITPVSVSPLENEPGLDFQVLSGKCWLQQDSVINQLTSRRCEAGQGGCCWLLRAWKVPGMGLLQDSAVLQVGTEAVPQPVACCPWLWPLPCTLLFLFVSQPAGPSAQDLVSQGLQEYPYLTLGEHLWCFKI